MKELLKKENLLVIIALVCFGLWWYSTQIKKKELPLVEKAVNWLPLMGGLAFATEAVIKLAQ